MPVRKGKSISLKRTSHSGHRDLARIRSLVDSLSFGSRQQLVRRLLVTSLRNQAMSIFGYLPAAKRQPKFNPWRLLFDESGDIGACIGDICTCFCMLACIGYCCETYSGCYQGCCGSSKYSNHLDNISLLGKVPDPPFAAIVELEQMWSPPKAGFGPILTSPRLRQKSYTTFSHADMVGKVCPIVRPP